MSPSDALAIRDATLDDLPAIAALRESVGWGVQPWALHLVIRREGARCLVGVEDDGTVSAVGSGIVYGRLGFVGNMVVAEEWRRRGIGSLILERITGFLEASGCERLELNATSEGRPLYERHGFRSVGTSSTAQIPRTTSLHRDREVSVRRASGDELERLSDYDRPRFGGDRRAVLEVLLADPDGTCLVAERDGALAGYGCVREDGGRIGPFVADAPSIAETILAEAFARTPAVNDLRLNLPPGNENGADWLRRLRVPIEGWDGRMARGAALPRREETIYGMTVGALG